MKRAVLRRALRACSGQAPYAIFAAVTLVEFLPFLASGRLLYDVRPLRWHLRGADEGADRVHGHRGDTVLSLPLHFRVYNEGLKAGELPLWHRRLLCGFPLYADPVVHPFYPPRLVFHSLLPPDPAYEIDLMLHLFFSGAAMYLLLRGLGRGTAAATAGGLVWMLFGYHRVWFSMGMYEGLTVFGPLALLALERGLERGEIRWAGLAAAAFGTALLGSHPAHALFFFAFFLLWAAIRGRDRALRIGGTFAALTVGVGLVAILTRLDSLANGYRPEGIDAAYLYDDPWDALVGLPGVVLSKVWFPAEATREGEFMIHLGLAGAVLAAIGAVRGFRDPRMRLAAIFAGASLAVIFVPPLAMLTQKIPILNLNPPTRWFSVVGLCLALLAAHGVDRLLPLPRRLPEALAAATAAIAVALLAFRTPLGESIETVVGSALAAGAAFAMARFPKAGLALGLAALAVDLVPPFVRHNAHADPALVRTIPPAVREVLRSEPGRAAGAVGSPYTRVGGRMIWEPSHASNVLALYGLDAAAGYEAISPVPYASFCLTAGGTIVGGGRCVKYTDFSVRLLDVTGLRYLFLPEGSPEPGCRWRLKGVWEGVRVFENPAALPRAYVVGRSLPVPNALEAARALQGKGFRPDAEVVLEGNAPALAGPTPVHSVAWLEARSNRILLDARLEGPGILVLSETDYPGWEARVNGAPVPLHRANLAFRAVVLPAGRHQVEFAFRPDGVSTGLPASAAFLALSLGLFFLPRLRRTGGPPTG